MFSAQVEIGSFKSDFENILQISEIYILVSTQWDAIPAGAKIFLITSLKASNFTKYKLKYLYVGFHPKINPEAFGDQITECASFWNFLRLLGSAFEISQQNIFTNKSFTKTSILRKFSLDNVRCS